ncbi:hypothetical protein H4S14_000675 [Agrobacterium vitis]|nr:hypothetical protein [Agrobacterium vitis]MBE1436948.1 hypothetical protein [Agrobacterium vitis]
MRQIAKRSCVHIILTLTRTHSSKPREREKCNTYALKGVEGTCTLTGKLRHSAFAPFQTRASILLCFKESDPFVWGNLAFYLAKP